MLFVLSLLAMAAPRPAAAQIYEAVGTRAQAMGGAFVAVADDATATWWNPAGLATGPYFSSVIERSHLDDPGSPATAGPARREAVDGVATTFPALGLSYYRFRVSEIRPAASIAVTDVIRQDPGATSVDLRSLAPSQFGVTIGQSIGQASGLASTLGVLHGGVATGTGTAAGSQSLTDADNLDASSETHADIDLGAMVSGGSLRLGASLKHVTRPTFGSGDTAVTLGRQARAGVAIVSKSGTTPLTLAADVDLTKTPTAAGDVQHIAVGAEAWLARKRRVGLSGCGGNLVGGGRPLNKAGGELRGKGGCSRRRADVWRRQDEKRNESYAESDVLGRFRSTIDNFCHLRVVF